MVKCPKCGAYVDGRFCSYCGHDVNQEVVSQKTVTIIYPKSKSKVIYALLLVFFGVLGFHRFYLGKIGTGILYLFTGGLFGAGLLYDILKLILSRVFDSRGVQIS